MIYEIVWLCPHRFGSLDLHALVLVCVRVQPYGHALLVPFVRGLELSLRSVKVNVIWVLCLDDTVVQGATVVWVVGDWVAQGSEVNSDLVCATGEQAAFDH